MKLSSKFAFAFVAATVAVVTSSAPAGAYKRWREYEQCNAPLEGIASSTGILGLGTARAREAAREDWESKASSLYGPKYGNLSIAQNVFWDCKKNALILAKCVVTAKPCGARLRG